MEEFRKKLRIQKDLDGKASHKEFNSEDVISLYEICFMEYGWSYDDLMNMPIPVFLETIEALKRRKKEEIKPRKKHG